MGTRTYFPDHQGGLASAENLPSSNSAAQYSASSPHLQVAPASYSQPSPPHQSSASLFRPRSNSLRPKIFTLPRVSDHRLRGIGWRIYRSRDSFISNCVQENSNARWQLLVCRRDCYWFMKRVSQQLHLTSRHTCPCLRCHFGR